MCPIKIALECENDDVVEDSLSGSSNDSDFVSKCNTKAFIWSTLDLNQTKREIRDWKIIQNAAFVD